MKSHQAGALSIAGLLLLVSACDGSTSTSTMVTDGGRDAALDARRDAKEDATDARGDGPVRVATTRGLLPTSVESLLLDPFVTSDQSWGHFAAVDPLTSKICAPLQREILSQSPVGVAGAVVVTKVRGNCSEILAPLSGATAGSVNAQIWISLNDATGGPLPFPTEGLDELIKVELVPNYLPSQSPQTVYPLSVVSVSPISPADGGTLPLTITGREWGLLALSAAPFAQGGWFVITLLDKTSSLDLAGPEVVPTSTVSLSRPHSRAMTDADRAVVMGYERARETHRNPAPLGH
jgi:hypothetical protein